MNRLRKFFETHLNLVRFVGYMVCLVAVLTLLAAASEARLQDVEQRELRQIARTLRTGDPTSDIQAIVDYAYDHAYLGDGKYSLLRASALQVLDPTIGGQCGEFVRLTINLLDINGYTAHRLYMFPQAPADGPFDPRTQPSFHVAAEVWVDGRWVAIDPLHGLVFHDTSGNLVTFQQVVADPSIIEAAYRDQPLEVHPAVGGGTVSGAYWITPETFANPQGLNWSSLLPVSGAYADIVGATHADLGAIYLPVVAEQPHAVLTIFWLAISGLCGVISGVCFVWQADRRPQPVAVLQLVPETYPDASV